MNAFQSTCNIFIFTILKGHFKRWGCEETMQLPWQQTHPLGLDTAWLDPPMWVPDVYNGHTRGHKI